MAVDTRTKLLALYELHPHAPIAAIAREAGVSRQRADQILRAEGKPTRRPYSIRAHGLGGQLPAPRTPAAPLRTGGVLVPLSHNAVGAVGELLVAADLMARGWRPFAPLLRGTSCDLIALSYDGSTMERIEVRTAQRRNGTLHYARPDTSWSDRRAIVVAGEPVLYDPPFAGEAVHGPDGQELPGSGD